MSIQEILDQAKSRIHQEFFVPEALLAAVLGWKKERVFLEAQTRLDGEQINQFEALFQRYLQGVPFAYLIHEKEFYGLPFYVDGRVLIPRPETELLVDLVKERWKDFSLGNGKILDVGTGSGCLALTLAHEIPQAQVSGIDISSDALEVAQLNAQRLGLVERINFFASDLLSNIFDQYDVIVANLPYIGSVDFDFVAPDVKKYEPEIALYSGADGLDLYRELFQQLKQKKLQPRFLFGEFGAGQESLLQEILNQFFDQSKISFHEDLARISRVFEVSMVDSR